MEQHHQAPPQFSLSATDAHLSSAANPTNPILPPSHPSYSEMITAAILWDSSQGKAGGSSKRAIAKYIDRVYTNLPPTHSALLTHHLKRLKNSGQLVMIRNSYQLPVVAAATTAPPPVPLRSAAPPPPPLSSELPSPTPKKRPGRPAKTKPVPQPIPATATLSPPPPAPPSAGGAVGNGNVNVSGKRPRGRPPRQPQQPAVAEVPFVQPIPQPNYATEIGINNGEPPVKRRPGRPPRKQNQFTQTTTQAQTQAQFQSTEQGLVVVPVNGTVVKRRPGRPPKAYVVAAPLNSAGGGPGPRPRGRPKRNAGLGPAVRPIGKKPRGRPPRQAGIAPGGGKRRGRPPKGSVPSGGVAKPVRKYTGKPRGRPKKNASVAGKQTAEQVAANEELMRKVENMQGIIADAVGVIRPYIANENAADALTALQQLENLSTMNLTASPIPTEPPMTAMSVNATVQVQPSTSVPAPQSTIAPPPSDTMTVLPTMEPPVVPFSIVGHTITETAPLYVPPTIENQQPASWIPSSEAQL